MIPTANDQTLQTRVSELEQQLAEAQATVQALTSKPGNSPYRYSELLFTHSRDIILFIQRNEGHILDANAAAIREYGYRYEEFLALTIHDLSATNTHRQTIDPMAKIDTEGIFFETTHQRKDGSTFPVEFYSQGATVGGQRILISVIRDITERKQVEGALRASEQEQRDLVRSLEVERARLAAILKNLPVGVWIADEQGRLIGKNEQADRIWAGDAPLLESIEKYPEYVAWFAVSGKTLLPEEYPVARALQTGQPVEPIELNIRRFDGTEGTVLVSAAPITDREGRLAGAVGVNVDISEHKRAEEAMRGNEKRIQQLNWNLEQRNAELEAERSRWQGVVEGMADEVWSCDAAGKMSLLNLTAMTAMGLEEFKDRTVEQVLEEVEILYPDGQPRPVEQSPLLRSLRGEIVRGEEIMRHIRTGKVRFRQYSSAPTRDAAGAITGAVAIVRDITEYKRAEAALAEFSKKLERSNQELEQFAFIASHDLQEPLRKIEAFGDSLLEGETQLDDRGRKNVERMRKAAGRMRDMVDGLLQLSRLTTQGQPFIPVDLSRTAAEVLSDLEYQVRRTGGRVEINELPVVEGDALQLQQLLQNLIGNALKYHRPDTPPVVKVYARHLPGRVQVLVEDNGIGFHPEEVERLFQPFQRLVGRNEYEGSGMGLAICRRIVERHGGEITARGEPGKGAVFTVAFPASV